MTQLKSTTRKLGQVLEITACCFHESGHVLYGLLAHMKITSVSITYSDVVEGTTYYLRVDEYLPTDKIDDSLVLPFAMDEVRMAYAGITAERLFYRDTCGSSKFPLVLKEGSSQDIKAASDTIKKANLAPPGKKRQELKRQVQQELAHTITEHWSDLKLIAHTLYKTKRLSFDDLKALLTKKSSRREYWKKQFREITMLFDETSSLDKAEIVAIMNEHT